MTIKIEEIRVQAERFSVRPLLHIYVKILNDGSNFHTLTAEGDLFITDNGVDVFVCPLQGRLTREIHLGHNANAQILLKAPLSFSIINSIEDIRKGKKVFGKVQLEVGGIEHLGPNRPVSGVRHSCSGQFIVETSQWIDDILRIVGYGNAEYVPLRFNDLFRDERIDEELKHFDEAIRHYNAGDFEDVLSKCRKVVDGIKTKEEKSDLPNKGNDHSETYKRAFSSARNYLSLASHPPSQVKARTNRFDAEFALLTTFGLVRYVGQLLKE